MPSAVLQRLMRDFTFGQVGLLFTVLSISVESGASADPVVVAEREFGLDRGEVERMWIPEIADLHDAFLASLEHEEAQP